MPTTFDEVRAFVRAITGDSDIQNYVYSDDALNQHIRLQIFGLNETLVQEDGLSQVFTQTLVGRSQAILAYRVARGLVSATPDYFQYSNPVMSAARRGGSRQLISHCEMMLSDLEPGGFLALKEDNEIFAYLTQVERWDRDYTDGLDSASSIT